MTEYVVGFLHDRLGNVVLIEKQHPPWQRGRLNGVGGHIEPGETPQTAMRREFQEEAGLDVVEWELAVVMTARTWKVYFFAAFAPLLNVQTQTDERVRVAWVHGLPGEVIPNLRWLIPLCLDSDIAKPLHVHDKGAAEAAGDKSQ